MDTKEYNQSCERAFEEIDACLEGLDGDFDFDNNGEICEVSFPDGRKIVINRQPPMREIWVADRSGGFHFRNVDGAWVDTRDGTPLLERLRMCVGGDTGQ